jgi:hydrogenase-4 component E
MNLTIIDPFLVAVLLLNFYLLGTGRLKTIVSAVAAQGVILGIVYAMAHPEVHESGRRFIHERTLLLAAAMVVIKGFVIPRMMKYAMRETGMTLKIDPYVGVTPSLLLGAVGTGLVMSLCWTLPLREEHASRILVSTSLSSVLTGFLMLTMRREALTQVAGYLVLENGIFVFGLLLITALPALVEIGVLLDLFVGVFVMGIIINHVNRQFPDSTSDHLSALRE